MLSTGYAAKLTMSSPQTIQPLLGIENLFDSLNTQGIRYCHWKSNCRLDQSIRGLTDLDLLIDSTQSQQFKVILDQSNIKPLESPPSIRLPGIEDYLGFDSDTGRLFHLHVHYQLILGEHFVKNYHLPLEESFLNNVQLYEQLIKIPIPELELSVLTIRALLKYRDRDAIKDILSVRSPGFPSEILDEITHLLAQTDWAKLSDALKTSLNIISPEIVLDTLKTVASSPRSGFLFFQLRNRLRGELIAYQRYSSWQATRMYFSALLQRSLPFLPRPKYKKNPVTGGVIVGFIGADGAGKSSVVSEINKWLSWKLQTYRYYMGSQQPSLITRAVELSFRAARKVSHLWGRITDDKNAVSKALMRVQQFFRNIYHLSVGYDRYHRYISAKRQAAQGAIVLCDRYPLEAIWRVMKDRPMDGPQIAIEAGLKKDWLTCRLSEIEQNTYRKIHPPDQIYILHVNPQVSQLRKPDHDPIMILNKSQALHRMDQDGLNVIEVDADAPIEQVLLQIQTALFQHL